MNPWGERVLIIAEAGVNHNGDFETASRMVTAASNLGADAIKFQTFKSENLASRNAQMAQYQIENMGAEETQFSMLKRLELSHRECALLKEQAESEGLKFFSTAFDEDSLETLKALQLSCWKIPSGEITNLPYLEAIGKLMQPVMLSTGMSTLGEVECALNVLIDNGCKREQICLLHCTTEYPAPFNEVNLKAMSTMGAAFGVDFGYSDHTQGITIPIAAVALGARVIEKHFTLDRNMSGPDHKASIEPDAFSEMVKAIRSVEAALGNGIKRPTLSELRNKVVARKVLVAKKRIECGDLFTQDNLTAKRSGFGISPMELPNILGKASRLTFNEDDAIEW